MASQDILDPNERRYTAKNEGKYLATRIITHAGITIAFALGKSIRDGSLFFDYSILNAADSDPGNRPDPADSTERLDSQCWFDNVKTLTFPSEVRVVGEEAVPVYEIPAVDRTGKLIDRAKLDTLDPWLSTSLCLTDTAVPNFEVLTDGKYIYIFRQSRGPTDAFLDRFAKSRPPIGNNLLCDRFNLVGSTLSRTLEVRYRRSRQKRLPLNERDTLAARDINDVPFYEPTFSLRFVRDMSYGRFTILQTPTTTNGMLKWMIFAFSTRTNQIECFVTDVGTDGLFDIHGQIYYTCDAKGHEPSFSTSPGTCPITNEETEKTCGNVRKAIVPKAALSERALVLDDRVVQIDLSIRDPIDLSGPRFAKGFTLEAWVKPSSTWIKRSSNTDPADDLDLSTVVVTGRSGPGIGASSPPLLPPAGTKFSLFSLVDGASTPSFIIDDQLRLCMQLNGESSVSATSSASLKVDEWNHVAITYTGGQRQTLQFTLDGTETDPVPFELPTKTKPGTLKLLVRNGGAGEQRFRGQLDEVRLWCRPLHPETIKAKMSNRATGMEPFLEACWHFDEGTGVQAFDATANGHNIDIVLSSATSSASNVWAASTAPILGNFGLSRRVLRLPSNVEIRGGIGSSVYYEQVSVSETDSKAKDEAVPKPETQPLKRGGRVLLCFVASIGSGPRRLSVVDFELTSDGTLCDWPAILPVPNLTINTSETTARKRAFTNLLYVDGEGRETFGGILDFDAARCDSTAPSVWESSTGSITIFFQDTASSFAALTYDVSRAIVADTLIGLSNHAGLRAASRLRQTRKVTINTTLNLPASGNVMLDLRMAAIMADGTKVVETWKGIPSDLEKFCNLLNGSDVAVARKLGDLANGLDKMSASAGRAGLTSYKITLAQPLTEKVPLAACVTIGSRRFFVLQEANANDSSLVVSAPYANDNPGSSPPTKGQEVTYLGYDHEKLYRCEGIPDGERSQGSTLLRLALTPSDAITSSALTQYAVYADKESFVTCQGQAPFFSSPASSSALQFTNDSVYSMLEEASATTSNPGIAFESWIKVDRITESAIVAYASERLPRSEQSSPEQQVFVLGIPASSNNKSEYELVGNVNGTKFSVNHPLAMKPGRWLHFACSLHNTLALRFSGSNYVDMGTATEWNLQDFTVVFTLQLNETGREQVVFTKGASKTSNAPLQIMVTTKNTLSLTYAGEDESNSAGVRRITVESPSGSPLEKDKAYKIFISRTLLRTKQSDQMPRSVQAVAMRAWRPEGGQLFDVASPSVSTIESNNTKTGNTILKDDSAAQTCGTIKASESPLSFGGAPWANNQGLVGILGHIRIYSAALPVPNSAGAFSTINSSERSLIGSWSFRGGDTQALIDDVGRNHGKLRLEPTWMISPYTPDHQLSVYINGVRASISTPGDSILLRIPVGPHQLTLGNSIHGEGPTRFLALRDGFRGELDELRIWNIPRTREAICDTMNARLSEIPAEIAVYLPFDDSESDVAITSVVSTDLGILADASINCWHLTPLHGATAVKVVSQAPVGHDASCVRHVLSNIVESDQMTKRSQTSAQPSVTEYGDMQVSASGSLEGAYKRAYSSISMQGEWCLNTGFRIGTLLTEWVSQVQTSPTLIGYIEGAPPIPSENFLDKDNAPTSSIKFSNAQKISYSYGLESEEGTQFDLEMSAGMGGKWEVSAGLGVETEVSAGEIKGAVKRTVNIASAKVNNNISTSETNTNLEMSMSLTGAWVPSPDGSTQYLPANTGLALVESEVADVFALRLKTRSAISPLVAYQMRPNPDIPKDRNLVSFDINKSYTKQGCLDGRRGSKCDPDYVPSQDAPKDASYYKPVEAYALKDRIRRAEEQLEGEYARYQLRAKKGTDLPSRTHRNICNSYVWTADGGTFQETHSTMDFVQTEVGGSSNTTNGLGGTFDLEVSAGGFLVTANIDALYSTSVNVMQTKDKSSESGFELAAELPPAVEIREDKNGKLIKRPGAVDTYRWMSFWLEPSVEGTDAFFKQVVDPIWLEQSTESNAKLLLGLRDQLSRQSGNARTKAWRVLHRVTYISRVLEPLAVKPVAAPALKQIEKKGILLADVSCNWLILQKLEPLVRGAKTRMELARRAQDHISELYPTIRAQQRLYAQLLDLLADFIGVE